jgi:hypothetical protein
MAEQWDASLDGRASGSARSPTLGEASSTKAGTLALRFDDLERSEIPVSRNYVGLGPGGPPAATAARCVPAVREAKARWDGSGSLAALNAAYDDPARRLVADRISRNEDAPIVSRIKTGLRGFKPNRTTFYDDFKLYQPRAVRPSIDEFFCHLQGQPLPV